MAMIRTAALLLQHRGMNGRWLLWWVATWVAAILCSRVGIPPVAPQGAQENTRALEQLGALGLCMPLTLIAVLLKDRSAWLSASTPRSRRRIRLGATSLIVTTALVTALVAALLYPNAIAYPRVVSLFTVALSITIITGTLLSPSWAALPAPAIVALSTIPGVVPWNWNIVYNPAIDTLLTTTALTALILALVLTQTKFGTPA